jgi:hypothetical protein
MFCAPGAVFGSTEASGPVFYVLCSIFVRTERVGSRFHVLRSRIHFRRYRGRRVPFSAVPTASGPVFLICAPGPVYIGIERVGSRFNVLRSQTHFQRYQQRRVPFSCFALPDSVSAVPRASGSVFMFCAHGPVFGDTDGVWSRYHILRSQTRS